MNSRPKKPDIYKIKQRFILFLPTAYAAEFNSKSTGNNLRIFLSRDMRSGRVMLNDKKLYATMLNTTCMNKHNHQGSNSPLKVLVCHEEKYKAKSSMLNNYFSIKTLVKKKNQNRVVPQEGANDEVSTSSSFSGETRVARAHSTTEHVTAEHVTAEHVTADTSFSN